MWSTIEVVARPVRILTRSWRNASTLLAMRALVPFLISLSIAGSVSVRRSAADYRAGRVCGRCGSVVRRTIMQVVLAARAVLDLQRRVVDPEAVVEIVRHAI